MTQLQESAFAPTITPRGEAVDAGPWRLTITDAQVGDAAYATIVSANEGNDAAPDGLMWVLAYVAVQNISDQPRAINVTDFAGTATDGILRRTPAMVCPEPTLQATVEVGASVEGWVPLQVNDTGNVVVWFSSPFLGGSWSQAWLALTDDASLPAFDAIPEDSGLGTSPDAPAAFGETVRTGDFDISVLEHISGQAVYDIAQFGLQALAGSSGVETWHAVKVRATNVSTRPAFFSFTALRIADFDGEAWDHVLALTSPAPDVAKEILPGATREGWATFDQQPWSALNLLRVQPSRVTDEPRFISFGDTPAAASSPATPNEPTPDFAVGDQAVLSEDLVNLRSDASASGEIVAELEVDTLLTITGDAVEADGYTWYPVEVSETGESGYVVADFLKTAESE
jgi:hypothetical protein